MGNACTYQVPLQIRNQNELTLTLNCKGPMLYNVTYCSICTPPHPPLQNKHPTIPFLPSACEWYFIPGFTIFKSHSLPLLPFKSTSFLPPPYTLSRWYLLPLNLFSCLAYSDRLLNCPLFSLPITLNYTYFSFN